MSFVRACSIMYDTNCYLSSQQHDSCIVMSSYVSVHIMHLGLFRHICWELTHVSIISPGHPEHPSIKIHSSIRLSRVYAKTFTAYVPASRSIIQPSTQYQHTYTVQTLFKRRQSETTPLITFHLCYNTRMCHRIARLGHKVQE